MTKVVSLNGPPVVGDPIVDEALVLIDAETSDNIKRGVDADHPSQPWLAELSMIFVVGAAGEWKSIGGYHAFIRPNAFWHMSEEATRVNGITDELLHQQGVPVTDVLDRWGKALQGGFLPCAFNYGFDGKIMRGAMRRAGRKDYRETPYVDTMLDAHPHVRATTDKGKIKFPNLLEACIHYGVPTAPGSGPYKAVRDNNMQLALLLAMIKRGHSPRIRNYRSEEPYFEPASACRIAPPVSDFRPKDPRSLADLPPHRQPTKKV